MGGAFEASDSTHKHKIGRGQTSYSRWLLHGLTRSKVSPGAAVAEVARKGAEGDHLSEKSVYNPHSSSKSPIRPTKANAPSA